ncbi:Rpn family recombination-promoting nuclease/putative transposase [Anaerovorax odorimutans]|uniref:Rpn family recombination-promoting nuclease/putative transposase n=1 Tax=Anaerovorax odorimutans TaxID=109327 RepID=A0ABT1RNM7_9FIRM|nr:Rpn family recombination-promoting nuclease/putative transposase [Anaerovorax odorimutans]
MLTIALTLKNDLIFKAVYGREDERCKQALIAVLNLILDRKDDPIRRIDYKNPFNTREFEAQKESILDIKAETDRHELLDLEIHLCYDDDFIPHNLFYLGGMIRDSLESGQKYGMMKKSICIFIIDFVLHEETDRFATDFWFMERRDAFQLTDLAGLYYLELPKVNPGRAKPVSQMCELERYLEYLRYVGEPDQEAYLEELRRQGGKEIDMTDELLRKATADEIIREQAIAREKFILKQKSAERRERQLHESIERLEAELAQLAQKQQDYEKELAEQRQALMQQKQELTQRDRELMQREQERKCMIRTLSANGMSADQIAQAIGLPQETVETYLKD